LPRECKILVVANRTALSAGLEEAMRSRLQDGPATFTLVVPLGRGAEARSQAQELGARLREVGLDVKSTAGDADPLRAVLEVYSPAEFDEIIVSTLPAWGSRWMKSGLPQRIERHTGALVRHVEAREMPAAHHDEAVTAGAARNR
jgi:hypothetical protein